MKRIVLGLMVVSAALVVFSQPALLRAEDINSMVANAKTASDQEAIAKHYDEVAADCSAKAEEHNNLITAYVRFPRSLRSSALSKHCEIIIKDLKDCAKEASDLAAAHREMAAELK